MVETLATCTTEIGKRNAVRAKSNQVPRFLHPSRMTSGAFKFLSYSAEQRKTTNTQAAVETAFGENCRRALAAFESSSSIHKIEVHAFVSV
jgi:hypothetical protein